MLTVKMQNNINSAVLLVKMTTTYKQKVFYLGILFNKSSILWSNTTIFNSLFVPSESYIYDRNCLQNDTKTLDLSKKQKISSQISF